MKYVFDSSVAVKAGLSEQDTAKAVETLDQYRGSLIDLIAPDIFTYEWAHALTRAERQQRLAIGEARVAWSNLMLDAPILIDAQSLIPRAIEIASRFRIGVYDCVCVGLAEREGCELLTADAKLVLNLQKHFPFIVDLATLP